MSDFSGRVSSWLHRIDAHRIKVEEMKYGAYYGAFLTVLGFSLLIGGAVLIPFPGPWSIVALSGIGVLAVRYHWARKLLLTTANKLDQAVQWVRSHGLKGKLIAWGTVFIIGFSLFLLNWFFFAPESWAKTLSFLPHKS